MDTSLTNEINFLKVVQNQQFLISKNGDGSII
jgi:hypothetical protein